MGHGLLKVSAVIAPIQKRRPIHRQHELQELQGRHLVLIDLIGIQEQTALGKLRGIGVPVRLSLAAHQERAGRDGDHLVLGRKLDPLRRQSFAFRRPFQRDVLGVQAPHRTRQCQEDRQDQHRVEQSVKRGPFFRL